MKNSVTKPLAPNGFAYFLQGFSLIKTPGIRRFVFVPLLVNLILFSAAFYLLNIYIGDAITSIEAWLPEQMKWLALIAKPLMYITALICFSFLFATMANWIAAPFNGLLAEKIEAHLSGQNLSGSSFKELVVDIPRTLKREWRKLMYYLPRAIGFFLILLFLPFIGQIIWFVFVAWMMAIQYCDYAFDNHKVDFNEMRNELSDHKGKCLSFGFIVALFSMIPILNLVLMPVAICGATAMWVDHFQRDMQVNKIIA